MKSRNWLVTALVVSVTINVFLGSMIAGRMVYERLESNEQDASHTHRHDRSSLRMELRALSSALPDDARATLRATLREKRTKMQPVFAEITESREEIRTLLSAETFDQAALQAAIDRLNSALAAIQAPMQDIILESAALMTPEQRKDMADALAEMERHHHGQTRRPNDHKSKNK